ncbi:MAG TPA: hydratase [Polaromonas sp.]|uniref:2-keto-4-pentenoate hydratase n=1 Tax=Polaromonas sp. TaxID=1869339 RepID=UPI002D48F07E|nr:hydratase [Polaromonas sp.]HYW58772.1 hydratase [Polaromonas sp.]
MMSPQELLEHFDKASLWSSSALSAPGFDLAAAYQQALAVRALRVARGEQPAGYKIGFTNRHIWQRYNVFAPIWGPVWRSSLYLCDGNGEIALDNTCQPRIEPEAVFCMRSTPPAGVTLEGLFHCLDWVAPGFEIVQSHQPEWKFAAPHAVADGALHASLLVGAGVPAHKLAGDAASLNKILSSARVTLTCGGRPVDQGTGANVLDGPLHALLHFLNELRACPGAPDLQAGDVVTTGTWTDAWPVAPGEQWKAAFDPPLADLTVRFT